MGIDRKKWLHYRRRLAQLLEVGAPNDPVSRGYDLLGTLILLTNVAVTVLYTFDRMELQYGELLLLLESVTVACFAVDYVLRLIAARFMYPAMQESQALRKYVFSF